MLAGFSLFFFLYAINSLALMNVFAFLRDSSTDFLLVDMKDLTGLFPQNKPYAVCLAFMLLVMSGLPPFSFFYVKYFLYVKLFDELTYFQIFILIVVSAIATFYYIRLVRLILFSKANPTFFLVFDSGAAATFFAATACLNIYIIFLGSMFIELLGLFNAIWSW